MYFNVDFDDEDLARLVQEKIETKGYETLLLPPMTPKEHGEEMSTVVGNDVGAIDSLEGCWTVLVRCGDSDQEAEAAGATIEAAISDTVDGIDRS